MSSVCDFSVSPKCCKFIEFYYASAFTGDKWDNHGGQATQFSFFVFREHEVAKCVLGVHLLAT